MKLITRAATIKFVTKEQFECDHCEDSIPFTDGARVVANIYKGSRWVRLESWHVKCYTDADEPYGEAPLRPVVRRRSA